MTKINKHPTKEELREVFSYCKTGYLIWKKAGRGRVVGAIAGCFNNQGYFKIKFGGIDYYAHRLIYIFHHGEIPDGLHIDHIDNNRTNNKIENLQTITNKNNVRKSSISSNNTSGFKGVYYDNQNNKFKAKIGCDGKNIYLGRFDCRIEAARVYDKAAIEKFGPFAIVNFPHQQTLH